MYITFLGFKEKPFCLTPDPRYFYASTHHKAALDHLQYGINERMGFIAITGGIGTGKTTLCRMLMRHLDDSTKSALIFNSFLSDMELLETVNQEFGVNGGVKVESKKGYVDALNEFLLHNFSQGRNAVLLIDEAQNLSHMVLEQIRMLSNLETEREKLIQIVLVGQPELRDLLTSSSLRQLDERVMVRYELKALGFKDVQGYVEHRLVVAGGRGTVRFKQGAYKKIYAYSKGNPRRINALCDRALLVAYAREKNTVSEEIVAKAIGDLVGGSPEAGAKTHRRRKIALATLLPLLLAAVVAVGLRYRGDLARLLPSKQEAPLQETAPQPGPAIQPQKAPAALLLDEKRSLAVLFGFFDVKAQASEFGPREGALGLVSLDLEPEYYVMFKRPFRVGLSGFADIPPEKPRFLLVKEVTHQGAIALDAEGQERPVTRDFILTHWGRRVSWVFPYHGQDFPLTKGMRGEGISKAQKVLNQMGYLVKTTGFFGEATFRQVTRLQEDFGLVADGIIGPETKALLYQMSDDALP